MVFYKMIVTLNFILLSACRNKLLVRSNDKWRVTGYGHSVRNWYQMW